MKILQSNKFYLLTVTFMCIADWNKKMFIILPMAHVFQFCYRFDYLAVELQRVSNQKTNWNYSIINGPDSKEPWNILMNRTKWKMDSGAS